MVSFPAMSLFSQTLKRMNRYVLESYPKQILEPENRDYGGIVSPDYGCASTDSDRHGAFVAFACYAYLRPESPLHHDPDLRVRIEAAIRFMRRRQRESGLIDLISVNIESPPDTAFTVQLFAPIVARARTAGKSAEFIVTQLGAYVRSAAEGIAGRGFHTPNHRWVICSALSQTMSLFEDFDAREYIDAILAETIDVNDDGQYSERSTGAYDGVVNRSLRYMADNLNMPELLDVVRRNLDLTTYLLHPDGSVLTSVSIRQDRGATAFPASTDSFLDMAFRDSRHEWLQLALNTLRNSGTLTPATVEAMLNHTEHVRQIPAPDAPSSSSPIPDRFRRFFPAAGIWRVRDGDLSAAAFAGTTSVFLLRYGSVELRALKVARCRTPGGRFEADETEAIERGVRLTQKADRRIASGYDLPLGRPVGFDEFEELRSTDYDHIRTKQEQRSLKQLELLHASRDRWTLPPTDVQIDIRETDLGFDIDLVTIGGHDRNPAQIELCFTGPGIWEAGGTACEALSGSSAFLLSGFGTFHNHNHAITVGPGSNTHRMWHMRGTEPEPDSFRVIIALETPIQHTLQIRYGPWNPFSNVS